MRTLFRVIANKLFNRMANPEKHGAGVVSLEQWNNRWQDGCITFHKEDVHAYLQKYYDQLTNKKSAIKILFPLCGKSVDMKWLADEGHTVVGVDISTMALEAFFSEQKLDFTSETKKDFTFFKSSEDRIRLYSGDFYKFDSSFEGKFDAVWDRGALVAINESDRKQYFDVIAKLCAPGARCLLDTYDYNSSKYPGPPHYISEEDIKKLYEASFSVEKLEEQDIMSPKHASWGLDYFIERVHLLTFKAMAESGVVSLDGWSQDWQKGDIGFHRIEVNQSLQKHYARFINQQRPGSSVFVPLCGKSVDIKWLADAGHKVVGVDISTLALQSFFKENHVDFTTERCKDFTLLKSNDGKIRLYAGDFFLFDSSYEGTVDAVWDRASLVAINKQDRNRYRDVITKLCAPDARILLETVVYDPSKYGGPPHYIPTEEITLLYGDAFSVEDLGEQEGTGVEEKHFGLDYFRTRTQLLTPKA